MYVRFRARRGDSGGIGGPRSRKGGPRSRKGGPRWAGGAWLAGWTSEAEREASTAVTAVAIEVAVVALDPRNHERNRQGRSGRNLDTHSREAMSSLDASARFTTESRQRLEYARSWLARSNSLGSNIHQRFEEVSSQQALADAPVRVVSISNKGWKSFVDVGSTLQRSASDPMLQRTSRLPPLDQRLHRIRLPRLDESTQLLPPLRKLVVVQAMNVPAAEVLAPAPAATLLPWQTLSPSGQASWEKHL